MILQIFLIIFQFNSIILLSFSSIDKCRWSKSCVYKGLIYIIGYSGVCLIGNDDYVVTSNYLNRGSDIGAPFISDNNVYTTRIFDNKVEFIKKSLSGSLKNKLTYSYLKNGGNVCLFKALISSNYYYYSAWIDSSSNINIKRVNYGSSDIDIYASIMSSGISNQGSTIDCDGFSYGGGHIICVFRGDNGCNLNIYSSSFTNSNTYSSILLQQNIIGFNCDNDSPGQKILNIDENKFLICYSKTNSNIYCLFGKHQTVNSLIITSTSSLLVLQYCLTPYSDFDVGKIHNNFIVVCSNNSNQGGVRYKIFNEKYEISGNTKNVGIPDNDIDKYRINLPFVLYYSNTKSIVTVNYLHYYTNSDANWEYTKYFNLTASTCTDYIFTGQINIGNIINLSDNIGNSNKVKIIEPPTLGSFRYNLNKVINSKYYSVSTGFNFTIPTGGEYTFKFYSYNDETYTFSDVCEGKIKIIPCHDTCFTCTVTGNELNHKCSYCLTQYGYYPLSEDSTNSNKNCYNLEKVLEFDEGYYLENDVWNKCYLKCKTCLREGTSINQSCLTCQNGYIMDPFKEGNCVPPCNNYWYRSSNGIGCLDICNDNYPYLVPNTKECVISCLDTDDSENKYFFGNNNICISKCPENTLPDGINGECHELKNFNVFYNSIKNYIVSIKPPSDIYIYNESVNFILYNSSKEGLEEYKNLTDKYNITYLNLEECLNKLKNIDNYIFYIALFEFKRKDVLTSQYNFIIYNKSGEKYNNEICDSVSVTKSFKNSTLMDYVYEIYKNSSIDIFNYSESNKFYNDICTTVTNDSYDILLEDRYDLYYNDSNFNFCEENCNVTDINFEKFKVNCTCSNLSSFYKYEKSNYKRYIRNKTIKDKDFQYLKCHISFNFLKKNVGNYIILTSFISQIINCIIFCRSGLNNIITTLNKLKSNPPKKRTKISKNSRKNLVRNYYLKDINKLSSYNLEKGEDVTSKTPNEDIEDVKKNNLYVYKVGNSIDTYYNTLKKKYNENNEENDDKQTQNTDNSLNEKIKVHSNVSCSKLYCFAIQNKHKLISLFINNKYDITVYKISLFILTFSLDIFFCCLFISNSHIQKLYYKKTYFLGKDEILIAIYSMLCSYSITKLIECFVEYKRELEKYEKNPNERKKRTFIFDIKSKIECKFIVYFFLTFIITGLTWYFVCTFFGTYKSKNTFINLSLCYTFNFIFSFIIPFIYYGFISCFLFMGISTENECLYEITIFLLKL